MQMKNNLLRHVTLLVAAVLLSTSFWSCSKDDDLEPAPSAISVTGVTLNKSTLSIQVGGSETLTATVAPKDASNKKVIWKSSDAAIATVDANGKVTGVKAGEATITVTTEDGGKTATCKVTVSNKEVKVTGVKLNKTATSLLVGGNETLVATILPENATNKKVTWKSSNAAVATVDAAGKVTAVKAGEATITVTTDDGGKTATCKVTVSNKEVNVTGVKLNKATLTLIEGASETLTATVAPADATNQKVTWKSSNAAVATVDANGKVTAVKAGEATITVTTEDGGKTATCKVTVKTATIAVTGVTLNKATLSLIAGASETLTATVAPADATNKKVTWKSSNAAVATVDAAGKVTAVKAGEATITVTTEDGAKTAACKVTVTMPVSGVTLNKTALTLNIGANETLTATVAPADATNKKVTWKSSDAAVASVDANGKVTGVKAGEATITVTTEDGGKTATCKVTVKPNLVSEITLAALAIYVGESKAVTATVKPDDATNKALTWKSSDESIATVDNTGKVTGKKIGTATITATARDGSGVSGSCTVTVLSTVKKVTVEPATLTLGQNKSYTLKATVEVFGSGTDTGVTWTSSDTTIATVDATGKVTTTDKTGSVTITATSKADPARKGTCTVTVSGDQTDIDFGDYGPGENW